MILYHGTNQSFDKIDLMKSKPNKDFGTGFTCHHIMGKPWKWQR